MNKYSRTSIERLSTCNNQLQTLFRKVLPYHDHKIIQGHRTEAQHKMYMLEGKTKVNYSQTYHRFNPSKAVDVAPFPIRWNDSGSFYVFAGVVKAVAQDLGIWGNLRWGGDWDRDGQYNDQSFNDLVHWEWHD